MRAAGSATVVATENSHSDGLAVRGTERKEKSLLLPLPRSIASMCAGAAAVGKVAETEPSHEKSESEVSLDGRGWPGPDGLCSIESRCSRPPTTHGEIHPARASTLTPRQSALLSMCGQTAGRMMWVVEGGLSWDRGAACLKTEGAQCDWGYPLSTRSRSLSWSSMYPRQGHKGSSSSRRLRLRSVGNFVRAI